MILIYRKSESARTARKPLAEITRRDFDAEDQPVIDGAEIVAVVDDIQAKILDCPYLKFPGLNEFDARTYAETAIVPATALERLVRSRILPGY